MAPVDPVSRNTLLRMPRGISQWWEFQSAGIMFTSRPSVLATQIRSQLFNYVGFSPLVEISQQRPKSSVTVILGPRSGVISGTVKDAVTGLPLSATFHLWRIAEPGAWIRTSAGSPYRMLVPAGIRVGLEVTAPGYQTWRYFESGAGNEPSTLKLESNQQVTIDVVMLPTQGRGPLQSDQRFDVNQSFDAGFMTLL